MIVMALVVLVGVRRKNVLLYVLVLTSLKVSLPLSPSIQSRPLLVVPAPERSSRHLLERWKEQHDHAQTGEPKA